MDVEEAIVEAVDAACSGIRDGHEIGQAEFTLFFYTPDACALWHTIRPVILGFGKCRGAHVEIRRSTSGSAELSRHLVVDSP